MREGPLTSVLEVCEEWIFPVPSTTTLFNPYGDENPDFDLEGAKGIRRRNLENYLAAFGERPPVVIVAEAPGPWGCRFSGVPITAEEQLVDPQFPLSGEVSGNRDTPHSEYSARIFWRVMERFFPRFVVWNALPLHPHRQGEPMSIRAPRVSELRSFAGVTRVLVECAKPEVVVAVGRKAEVQLGELGVDCRYVRHPSQGGARLFEEGMVGVFEELGGSRSGGHRSSSPRTV